MLFQWNPTKSSQNTSAVSQHNNGKSFPHGGLKYRVSMRVPVTSPSEAPADHVFLRVRTRPGYVDTLAGVCAKDGTIIAPPEVTRTFAPDTVHADNEDLRIGVISNKGVIAMYKWTLKSNTR